MKRSTLATLALALVSSACQDTTAATSPQKAAGPELRYDGHTIDNPPPPPIDTGAVGPSDGGAGYQTFNVTYFFNPTGNAGYLKFDKNQEGSTEVDRNAQVRYSQGVFSGKGFVTITESAASELVIDLSTVTQASSFSSCAEAPAPALSPTAEPRPEGGCFSVSFSGVTRNGTSTGSPYVLVPGCRSTRESGEIIPCVRPDDPSSDTK